VLVIAGKFSFEVATFRTDVGYQDGRHPAQIRFSTPQEDAQRRDFTINGLFWDPVKRKIIDYVHGQEDIKRRIVRAIGDPEKRFEEDKLRMLRAVRFSAALNFKIDSETWAAILRHAREIEGISAERIRQEMTKMMTGPGAGHGVDLLRDSRLLDVLLPEVAATEGVQQPPEFHPEGDVYTHTKILLQNLSSPTPTLAFAALLHDVGKPPTFKIKERIRFDGHDKVGAQMAQAICMRLKFSNDETEKIVSSVANHMRFKDVQRMRVSTLKRMIRQPNFQEELELHRVDCLASHKMLDNWRFLKKKLKEFSAPEALKPRPLLTGNDLLKMGYPQGPVIGQILRAIEEQQLEGNFSTQAQALELVRREFVIG
ncbi:MAG: CCA tRNA nucleotidyltransferase, partial [Candidatus Omnitrophica bacterium]|nr:CCA tRNA nucleotidyltransferase [Candidatus Omnitrophota bacterium]